MSFFRLFYPILGLSAALTVCICLASGPACTPDNSGSGSSPQPTAPVSPAPSTTYQRPGETGNPDESLNCEIVTDGTERCYSLHPISAEQLFVDGTSVDSFTRTGGRGTGATALCRHLGFDDVEYFEASNTPLGTNKQTNIRFESEDGKEYAAWEGSVITALTCQKNEQLPEPEERFAQSIWNHGPSASAQLLAVDCREASYAHDIAGAFSPSTGRFYFFESSYNHSIDVAYIPGQRRFVVQEGSYSHDIDVIYNPQTGQVESLESSYSHRIGGFYNPDTGTTKFLEGSYEHGVDSVWNTATHQGETKEGQYAHSVVGAYNPATQTVEFCESSYRHGVAAYYDPITKSVICKEASYEHGMACVALYDDGSIISNHSHSPEDDDDE